MNKYGEAIDKLISLFSSGKYESEVSKAKEDFYKAAGIFDEESSDVEMKINLFTEWYLFERPLSVEHKTPVALAAAQEDDDVLKVLVDNRHSLFEFIKVKDEDVHVKDLFSGYKLILKKSPVVIGFNKDEIFEARLFPYEDSFVFSNAFCIHPSAANKYIKKEIKAVKKMASDEQDKGREALILKLLKMRYKMEQYRHVDLMEIYTNESKLRM